jgi:crotonobetainyl-CoA:carnitine CoA-transferase CaiB-like acyl-CoA transferase
MRAINPAFVYATVTGWGTHGPRAERPGYDSTAFWAGSGITGLMGDEDDFRPIFRPAAGDRTVGLMLLVSVLAALRMRDQTGEPQAAEIALQAAGMWTIASDTALVLATGRQPRRMSYRERQNPLSNAIYRCADGRWIQIAHPVPFPFAWPTFCKVIGHPEWAEEYDDIRKLKAAAVELSVKVQDVLIEHDVAYWAAKLDEAGLLSAPIPTIHEVVSSDQVRAMGWITELKSERWGTFEALDTPFKLPGTDTHARGPAPELGENTAELLDAIGVSEEERAQLAANGVFG